MANVKVTVDFPIVDGSEITFKAPCDCSEVTGLIVYYSTITESSVVTASKTFTFMDAHGNDLSNINNLFAENSYVKVILDVTNGKAYLQNADNNGYLNTKISTLESGVVANSSSIASVGARTSTLETRVDNAASDISSLKTRATSLESRATSLESGLSTTNTNLNSVEDRVKTLETDVDTLETNFNSITSSVYTTFDSDSVSSGNVKVTKIFNKFCLVEGNITITETLDSVTQILDSSKVPANAAGTRYINCSCSNKSTFTRPLAVQTTASGGLHLRYGAAARYDFSWFYVIA